MKALESVPGIATALRRGIVVGVADDAVVVADRLASGAELACDVLEAAEAGGPLRQGDTVLFVPPSDALDRGVVLGRIGRAARPRADVAPSDGDPPDELLLEARRSLTLRVGDGSITIRDDGRILIKGRDLVSHATRRNRIKGGSVEIN